MRECDRARAGQGFRAIWSERPRDRFLSVGSAVSTFEVRERQVDYYGHTLRVFAVRIDGQLVSDTFGRFDASADSITSEICEECYAATGGQIAICGEDNIAVRRHGDTVYWFLAVRERVVPMLDDVASNHVRSFPRRAYEKELSSDASPLRDFDSRDIHWILNLEPVYPAHLGLFTIPDVEDDPQGRRLLDVVARVVQSRDLVVCDAPAESRTIRIGIDTKGVPEVVVEMGKATRGYAMRLVANPGFPLWLTCDSMGEAILTYFDGR